MNKYMIYTKTQSEQNRPSHCFDSGGSLFWSPQKEKKQLFASQNKKQKQMFTSHQPSTNCRCVFSGCFLGRWAGEQTTSSHQKVSKLPAHVRTHSDLCLQNNLHIHLVSTTYSRDSEKLHDSKLSVIFWDLKAETLICENEWRCDVCGRGSSSERPDCRR